MTDTNGWCVMGLLIAAVAGFAMLAASSVSGETRKICVPEYSAAGLFTLEGSGREVLSANGGWKYAKGDVKRAEEIGFDDSKWDSVNLPHGLELLPAYASGGINYRGPAWYRTKVRRPSGWDGKQMVLHFEAVMGNAKVWVNGKLAVEHHGGYLPFAVDMTDALADGKEAMVAVRADNSDDPTTPPGKPQNQLDYCYFGGIYRDVWLIGTEKTHISDPNDADIVAGGGVFTHTSLDAAGDVTLLVRVHVIGTREDVAGAKLRMTLRDAAGKQVAEENATEGEAAIGGKVLERSLVVKQPALWSPDSPTLYELELRLTSASGKPLDGGRVYVGLRTIEFKGTDGFWLNGKPFPDKLMGTNRHQDYGYIGNALPNSLHWRDVAMLRAAGMRVIRTHYPLDPAFMDACDRLGVFMVVGTPGWQFWNDAPIFEQRVHEDIRNMVRRDRNRACMLLWEPILNETSYPKAFPKRVRDVVHEEYPYDGAYAAGDAAEAHRAQGGEAMDISYTHPRKSFGPEFLGKSLFFREWGDNVDDWRSQNSDARLPREMGETAQLVQAMHLGRPPYEFICYDDFYKSPRQMVGGAQWHSFDHQRGCHADPFLGGIADAFRQPKYSYYLFASQRDPKVVIPGVDTGPMLFVAWEMSPASPADITVFTNCDEVRMRAFGGDWMSRKVEPKSGGMPHPPVVFQDVFGFMKVKGLHRSGKADKAEVEFEGLIGDKVVVSKTVRSPKKTQMIRLSLADEGVPLVADGSDIMPVVATIVDNEGNAKHFREEDLVFTISGEGRIVGDERIGANPCRTAFGTAPVLVQSTGRPGKIRLTASPRYVGPATMKPGVIEFESVSAKVGLVNAPVEPSRPRVPSGGAMRSEADAAREAEEVADQQEYFETSPLKPAK